MRIKGMLDNPKMIRTGVKVHIFLDQKETDNFIKIFPNFRNKPMIAELSLSEKPGMPLKVKCTLDNPKMIKSGMKVILVLVQKEADKFFREYPSLRDKTMVLDLRIDEALQREIINRISQEQRNKIYAILNDISNWVGWYDVNETKREMKSKFLQVYDHYDYFSLSDCPSQLAGDYITFLIIWCFRNGIELKDHPRIYFDDIESFLYLCLKFRICSVCGKPAEVHHWDAIGMGRDRREYDDSDNRKIALCRDHHNEVETIGRDTFADKYHLIGIIYAA